MVNLAPCIPSSQVASQSQRHIIGYPIVDYPIAGNIGGNLIWWSGSKFTLQEFGKLIRRYTNKPPTFRAGIDLCAISPFVN